MITTHDETEPDALADDPVRTELGLFTDHQFAKSMGVTTLTTATWRKAGSGPDYVKAGKRIFYRKEDILAWIKTQRQILDRRAG